MLHLPPTLAPIRFSDLMKTYMSVFETREALYRNAAKAISDVVGSDVIALTNSGKAALMSIIEVLRREQPEKTEVIVPAYTCYSVPAAVHQAGAKVVLCDMAPETFDYDRDTLAARVNEKTLAVVANNFLGIACDIDAVKVMRQSAGFDFVIIEDAAQAFGIEGLGRRGDVGFFSFGRGKHLCLGHGGAIVTACGLFKQCGCETVIKNPDFAGELEASVETHIIASSLNSVAYTVAKRIPALHVGETIYPKNIEKCNMSKIALSLVASSAMSVNEQNAHRKKLTLLYDEAFGSAWNNALLRYPLMIEDAEKRQQILTDLEPYGVGQLYPSALCDVPEVYCTGDYPGARRIAEELITLPTHVGINDDIAMTIIKNVKSKI